MSKAKNLSRRGFLKAGGTAAGAAALTPALTGLVATPAQAYVPFTPSPLNLWPGRIAVNYNNTHNATLYGGTDRDKFILKKMVDDTIMLLTGETTVAKAWRKLFPDTLNANSKIAFKSNNIGPVHATCHPFLLMGMMEGLKSMNVGTDAAPAHLTNANFFVYDRALFSLNQMILGTGFNQTNFPGVTVLLEGGAQMHAHTGADAGAAGPYGDSQVYSDTLFNCDFLIIDV